MLPAASEASISWMSLETGRTTSMMTARIAAPLSNRRRGDSLVSARFGTMASTLRACYFEIEPLPVANLPPP